MGRRQPESAGRFSKAAVLAATVGMFALAGAGEALAEAPASHETHTDAVAVQQHEQAAKKAVESQQAAAAAKAAMKAQVHPPQPPVHDAQPPTPPTPPKEKQLPGQSAEQQDTPYNCGPAATTNALKSMGKPETQDDAAHKLGTTEDGTDSVDNVTNAMNSTLGSNAYESKKNPTPSEVQKDVKNSISDNHAVVANVQGTVEDTEGKKHSFPGGHYLTVTGYGDEGKTLTISDSYDTAETGGDGFYQIPAGALASWVADKGIAEGAHGH